MQSSTPVGLTASIDEISEDPEKLYQAAVSRKWKTIKSVVRRGCDITPALRIAVEKQDYTAAYLLMEVATGAHQRPDEYTELTPVMLATTFDRSDWVQILLDSGCDVNAARLGYCETALMLAARENHLETLRVLVAAKDCNLDAINNPNRETALIFALIDNNWECAQLLIEAGCDVNSYGESWGQTPMVYAVNSLNPDITSLLIEAGNDVDSTGSYGGTFLEIVFDAMDFFETLETDDEYLKAYECARVLIEAGCSLDIGDTMDHFGFINKILECLARKADAVEKALVPDFSPTTIAEICDFTFSNWSHIFANT